MDSKKEALTQIMPLLTPTQREYIEGLEVEAQALVADLIRGEGLDYLLENWVMLEHQMEYVRTLL